MLSKGEQAFIAQGIEHDVRMDGRTCNEIREIRLSVESGRDENAKYPADASCRLVCGGTDILVGVSVNLETPAASAPTECPISVEFDVAAAHVADTDDAVKAFREALVRDVITSSGAIDTSSPLLCPVPYVKAWAIFIDVVVFSLDGGLLDLTSVALKAALSRTAIPATTVTDDTVVIDASAPSTPLPGIERLPVLATVGKYGTALAVDLDQAEEHAGHSFLAVAVSPGDDVSFTRSFGDHGIALDDIPAMISAAQDVARRTEAVLDTAVSG